MRASSVSFANRVSFLESLCHSWCVFFHHHLVVVVVNLLIVSLGDDNEESSIPRQVAGPVRDVLKKPTSSKKTDTVPAPRPARSSAGAKKPAAAGSEAAFKDRSAGRDANRKKSTDAPAAGSAGANRRQKNPRPDRHSQTGKVDTAKKVQQGWGDDNKKAEDEAAGETIAKVDAAEAAAEDATPIEEPDLSVTLEQYLEDLKIKAAETEADIQIRKPNEGAEGKWKTTSVLDKKEQEAFVASTKTKVLRSKAKKEKVLIEVEPVFASPSSGRPERSGGDRRGGDRGDRSERRGGDRGDRRGAPRGGRGDRRGGDRKPAPAAKAVNITSADEFPVLGA